MKFFAVFACVLAVANAQYVASGWKPQGARLVLPTEYGAPVQAAEVRAENSDVEITQENLEFVGQLAETTTYEPSNEYLPPTTTEVPEEQPEENQDPLTIQQLPSRDTSRSFHEQPKKRVGELRRLPERFQQQRFARIEEQPQEIYGAPLTQTTTETAEEATTVSENLTEKEAEEVEDENVEDPSLAVASTGQYYVLAPDNTLRKVTFYTRPSEDDRSNGFTAQLRYEPVQPIRDPIYAFNEHGQLVRVYNKK